VFAMMFVSMEFKIIQICFIIQFVTNKDQWNYNKKKSFIFGHLTKSGIRSCHVTFHSSSTIQLYAI